MTQPLDLTQKPADTSGASSGNRFSFQIDWAFSKLIELHRAGNDYLIFLDLHDDVVVANSETAPSTVDFYQVKTSKKKEWTEARLTYRKKGKSLSILGKLYAHKLSFPSNTGVAVFVSNRHCGLEAPAKFKDAPKVLSRTLDIAERCNLKLEKVPSPFPHFDVPDGFTLDSYFEHVTREGFARRMEALRSAADGVPARL